MKKILIALALLSVFGFSGSYTLTVVSYNVGVFSKYTSNSTSMVADMMEEVRADVIGLCELDSCNLRHNCDQLSNFTAQMGPGWTGHFGKAISFGGGGYGVGAAVGPRFAVLDSYTVPLPKGAGSESRAAAVVETERFVFAVAHLDYANTEARLAQARLISETLSSRYGESGKAVILCGDFNAKPTSETLEYFQQDWDIVTPPDPSFPSDNPRSCIDYIMVLKGSANYRVVGRAGARSRFKFGNPAEASDHLPVIVKLRIR